MRNNMISARELTFAAISSRLFIFASNLQSFKSLSLVEIIIAEFINFILVYIVYFLFRKKSFTENKPIRLITSLYLLIIIISTTFTLSYFTTNNLSYNYSYLLIPILSIILSIYLVNKGIEGVSRFSQIVVFIVSIIIFSFLFILKNEFNPSFINGEALLLYRVFYYLTINFEVILMLIYKNNTKDFSFKSIDVFNKVSFFLPVISYISFSCILGPGIIKEEDFPLKAIVDFVSVVSGNNLSHLFTTILIILAITRIAFSGCCIFKLLNLKSTCYILPTLILTLVVILARKLLILTAVSNLIYLAIPLLLSSIIILASKKESGI